MPPLNTLVPFPQILYSCSQLEVTERGQSTGECLKESASGLLGVDAKAARQKKEERWHNQVAQKDLIVDVGFRAKET